jgi:hypothetical protein
MKGHSIPQFEFAESIKSLAFVKLKQGKTEEVIKLSGEAAEMLEAEEGLYKASTQIFRFYYAIILFNAGNCHESLALHQDILQFRKTLLGNLSHSTQHSAFAVGFCLLVWKDSIEEL